MNKHLLATISIILLVCSTTSIFAKDLAPCGTIESEEMRTWLRNHQANPIQYKTGGEDHIDYVALQFHLVGTDQGENFFSVSETFRLLCETNNQFSGTGIQFFHTEEFNYISNSNYYEHDYGAGGQMMNQYNEPNVVNVYVVDDPAGNCGYFSWGGDALAVAKSCSDAGSTTLAHELGHYFSLPHTFSGWEGAYDSDNGLTNPPAEWQQERADGSNCLTAGDGFCDTPADYLSFRWSCPYTNSLYDPTGALVVPDESYYMSYALDACTSRFSEEQKEAMVANLYSFRGDLLGNPTPNTIQPADTYVFHPGAGQQNVNPNNIVLSWKAAEGADKYYVEAIQYANQVSGTNVQTYTTDTFLVGSLDPFTQYYVSVIPMNDGNTCAKKGSTGFKTALEDDVLYLADLNVNMPKCKGDATGSIYVQAAGGEEPYTYEWSEGSTTQQVTDLAASVYKVTVTDANGVSNKLNVTLPEPQELEMEVSQAQNGTATVSIDGGTLPYDIEWSNGETTETAFALPAGNSSVIVKDANGCTITQEFTNFGIIGAASNVTCNGANDGSIVVVMSGGVEPYTYEWSNGETISSLINLGPADYEVTVTDAEGANIVLNYTVEEPAALEATVSVNGDVATISASGGTPPYNYFWPFGFLPDTSIEGLPNSPFYDVTVYDLSGCTFTVNFSVTQSNVVVEDLTQNNSINMFPTLLKASQYLNIERANVNETLALSLYNAQGQKVYETTVNDKTNLVQVSLPSLQTGLYFVQLQMGEKVAGQKIMIVE
jgi:hypothetical protein